MSEVADFLFIRRLWPTDQLEISEHFSRLDQSSRRMRFGGAVSDDFVNDYAQSLLELGSVAYGAFPDGELRAVGELRGVLDRWPAAAEAAFSVQSDWQDHGIGEALMTRVIAAAQNRGVASLNMVCLRDNSRMQHLAEKHNAVLSVLPTEVTAFLDQPWPTPASVAEEVTGEALGFVRAVMQWQR